MRDGGRVSAAIDILTDFDRRRVPLKTAIADWARNARYAGAKDRAYISGLCLDVLRRRQSLAAAMGDPAPRVAVLAALRFLWRMPAGEIATLCAEVPHGPGPLSETESFRLGADAWTGFFAGEAAPAGTPAFVAGDFPHWLEPHFRRAFGDDAAAEGAALAARADIDLRLNTLKTDPSRILAALAPVGGAALDVLATAARIEAPASSDKAPAVTVIPAFNKGWVEVQDLGSQIAAAAAGAIEGAQVLDFCSGGGGKTLALAALMRATGQLYAYDADPRRLAPVYERARRAGVRNLQIRNPAGGENLDDLAGKMDVVFVDAPCTGAGTWRRHPDTKWRLTPEQLERRIAEQDAVLEAAQVFVKPGGRMVFATCSVLMEENEDRLARFCAAYPDFVPQDVLQSVASSGLLTDGGKRALEKCCAADGALRLTPRRIRSDGFFIAVLERRRSA